MKIKVFDVVELKDKNKATILEIKDDKYFAEIVNPYGITIDRKKEITKNDIAKIRKHNEITK